MIVIVGYGLVTKTKMDMELSVFNTKLGKLIDFLICYIMMN